MPGGEAPTPIGLDGPGSVQGSQCQCQGPWGRVRDSGKGAFRCSPQLFSVSPEVPTPLEPEPGAGLWGPHLALHPPPPPTTSGRVACHWDLPGHEGLPPQPCRWPPPLARPGCWDPPARHQAHPAGIHARPQALPPQLLRHPDCRHPFPSECPHEGQMVDRWGRAWGGTGTVGPGSGWLDLDEVLGG